MSLRTEHTSRVHEAALHQVDGLLEAGPAHKLCRPVEYGGRWWVWCLGDCCEWIGSCDREIDLPTRCEVEQLTASFDADLSRTLRLAHREFSELQRLALKRTA
jgi:hypothetical protein